MKWTYDPQADAIYLNLAPWTAAADLTSVGINDQVILDVDKDGSLAGIEIIGGTEELFPKLRRLLDREPQMLGEGDAGGPGLLG